MSTNSIQNSENVEKISSKQQQIFTFLLIIGILLVLLKYITPLENLVSSYIELAESEANSVAGSALITFGAARLINAAISFAQEVSFSVGFFGGADFSPFKVLEPIDDSIERFSDMLFYMLIAFKMMAIFFTPLIVLGDIALLIGLTGVLVKIYIISLHHIDWPRKLVSFGLFAYLFPLSFLLAMQLGNLVIEDRIQSEFKVFSDVIDEAGLEEISETESEIIEIENVEEQSVTEQVNEENQPESQISWWEFWKSDSRDDQEIQNNPNDSWWRFWESSNDDPGIFSTLNSFWGLTLNVWDQVAQATKVVGTLLLNSGSLIDASLTLLALYLIKLILIPALFLYFSIKLLRVIISHDHKFFDYSMDKMNPFKPKDATEA